MAETDKKVRTVNDLLDLWDQLQAAIDTLRVNTRLLLETIYNKLNLLDKHSSRSVRAAVLLENVSWKWPEKRMLVYRFQWSTWEREPSMSWDFEWYSGQDDPRLFEHYCRDKKVTVSDLDSDLGRLAHVEWELHGWQEYVGYYADLEPLLKKFWGSERRTRGLYGRQAGIRAALEKGILVAVPELSSYGFEHRRAGARSGVIARVQLGERRLVSFSQDGLQMGDVATFHSVPLDSEVPRESTRYFDNRRLASHVSDIDLKLKELQAQKNSADPQS